MKGIISVITPNSFSIPFVTAKSFINSVAFAKENFGYQNVSFCHVSGPLVEENRNNVFKLAKGHDWLLMIDSDMVFEPHQVAKIISNINTKADLICGKFKEGHVPHKYPIYKSIETFERITDEDKGLVAIEGCGAAYTILGKKIIDTYEAPFTRIEKNGVKYGEDISLCLRLKEDGMTMLCDTTLEIGHVRMAIV